MKKINKNRIKNYQKKFKTKAKHINGALRGNLVNTYWGGGPQNLGDYLPPILLEHYGLTPKKVLKSVISTAELLTIGSILELVSEDYQGLIVGSGLMYEKKRSFENAKIMAVRGALTRDLLGASKDTSLGDPGLLVPEIYKQQVTKHYILGLIPHYVDKNNKIILNILNRYPNQVKIIDIQGVPLDVIKEIDQCEYVLSSSLHGLITADSLEIPAGWILLSEKVAGSGFKFKDYASSMDMTIKPSVLFGDENLTELIGLTRKTNQKIFEIQNSLNNVFEKIVPEIKNNRKLFKDFLDLI